MSNVLLTNANYIKSATNISDNVNEKYLLPAIREAQEIGLKNILGEKLLNKVKDLIAAKEINKEENEIYKSLLDNCQYYLAYQTVSNLCYILSYKLDNMGLSRTADENVAYASADEVVSQSDYYERKADFFKLELQNFLVRNISKLPEVSENQCHTISANLYSADSGGLVLGGARGKGHYRKSGYIGK